MDSKSAVDLRSLSALERAALMTKERLAFFNEVMDEERPIPIHIHEPDGALWKAALMTQESLRPFNEVMGYRTYDEPQGSTPGKDK